MYLFEYIDNKAYEIIGDVLSKHYDKKEKKDKIHDQANKEPEIAEYWETKSAEGLKNALKDKKPYIRYIAEDAQKAYDSTSKMKFIDTSGKLISKAAIPVAILMIANPTFLAGYYISDALLVGGGAKLLEKVFGNNINLYDRVNVSENEVLFKMKPKELEKILVKQEKKKK